MGKYKNPNWGGNGRGGQPPQVQIPQKIQFNVSELDNRTSCHCPDCMNQAFRVIVMHYIISALESPIGQELLVDVPMSQCLNCGAIHDKLKLMRLTPGERKVLVAEMQKAPQKENLTP